MKIFLILFFCLILLSCCSEDSVVNPDNDFITRVYIYNNKWEPDLYPASKILLNIALSDSAFSLTNEIIIANIPDKFKTRKMMVIVGTMTKEMTYYQPKFYYINTEIIYLRDDMSLYIGLAYIFTEKNDSSIYFCKILMI
jgi:hypothetical protein